MTAPSLSALRAETAPCHRRLESRLGFLVDHTLTDARYRQLLCAMLGFVEPLERQLAAYRAELAARGIGLDERSKVDALRRDLHALAMPESTTATIPPFSSLAEALGALYVIEGATLGGRIIARAVALTLQIGPADGAAFYHGYGEATAPRWRQLTSTLSALDAAELPTTVAGAIRTFEQMEAWLESRGCL